MKFCRILTLIYVSHKPKNVSTISWNLWCCVVSFVTKLLYFIKKL